MRLCNYCYNQDKDIVPKSLKGTKRVEPAGFVFFILREWKVKMDTKDIFEVDLNTRNGEFEISELDLENVKEFSAFLQKYENSKFSYFYKLIWTRIILSDFVTSSESESGDENVTKKKEKKFKSIKTLGLVRNFIAKNQNAYQLLNCQDSDETLKIKSNYRKLVLLLHPDKSSNQKVPEELKEYERKYKVFNMSREEKSNMFLLLQDAFTILSDPDMRLEYDSNLPFDEYIPTHEEAKRKDFFALFGPVFQMNSRWSRVKPVPSLGDNESEDNYVDDFYEFWRTYETLRTFSHAAPHLLEDAESREEKRWMERENLKVQKKLVKKEQLRIQKLVDLSQQYDPRLKRRHDRIKLEKLEKLKKAQEAKDEEMRRIKLEKEKEELEKQKQAERIKFEKQIAKKMRQQLRCVCQKDEGFTQVSRNFDKLPSLDYTEIKEFSHRMFTIAEVDFNFENYPNNEYLEDLKNKDSSLKDFEVDEAKKEQLYKLFEEISLKLDPTCKDTVKQEATVSSQKVTKASEEKGKEGQGQGQSQGQGQGLWTTTDLGRLAKAVELNPAGTPGRWNLISKFVRTKSVAQCIEMAKMVANNADISAYMETKTDAPNTNGTVESSKGSVNGVKEDDKSHQPEVDASGWTTDQQTAFESALAKYPSHIDPLVRWRKIASEVPGKTPKECLNRFKQIKAAISSRKLG